MEWIDFQVQILTSTEKSDSANSDIDLARLETETMG
jgi:hypothetical protein